MNNLDLDKTKAIKTYQIELVVVRHFDCLRNLIVPNVWWGFGLNYEADMVVVSKAGYASEVEIKTDKYDLIKDKKKRHGHNFRKFKYLYFAIPYHLLCQYQHIPERAGIIVVWHSLPYTHGRYDSKGSLMCKVVKKPKIQNNYQFTNQDFYKLARLGAIRIWNLKQTIMDLNENRRKEQEVLDGKSN